jgi:hypothetical protein
MARGKPRGPNFSNGKAILKVANGYKGLCISPSEFLHEALNMLASYWVMEQCGIVYLSCHVLKRTKR